MANTALFKRDAFIFKENAMAEIYALKGRANCGKSSTIKEIFQILDAKYPNCIKKDYYPNHYDKKIEMQNIKGFLVGIESQADPNSRLEKSLNDFEQDGCDIIFCATRTRGMTVQWVKSHSKKYHINFIKQTIVGNDKQQQSQRNQKVAQTIISKAGL
jgi:ABC-type dipeptide/oligopeptide/nickel transport system ATPase component